MKCSKCGIETEEDFSFCPNCGSPAESPLGTQPYTYPITAMLKDTLFLVICILMSAATVFSFVGGSIPIIATLETVFLWIIYARMRINGTPDPQSMRWLSGTIFASYIVNWVVVGLIAVTGVLSSMVLGYIVNNYWLFEEYFGRMSESVFSIISASSGFLMVAMLAVAAFVAVINYFSTRSFHKLAKSMYESVERGTVELQLLGRARTWLMVAGVLSGIGALMSLAFGDSVSFFGSGCAAASNVVAYVLLAKYFTDSGK